MVKSYCLSDFQGHDTALSTTLTTPCVRSSETPHLTRKVCPRSPTPPLFPYPGLATTIPLLLCLPSLAQHMYTSSLGITRQRTRRLLAITLQWTRGADVWDLISLLANVFPEVQLLDPTGVLFSFLRRSPLFSVWLHPFSVPAAVHEGGPLPIGLAPEWDEPTPVIASFWYGPLWQVRGDMSQRFQFAGPNKQRC